MGGSAARAARPDPVALGREGPQAGREVRSTQRWELLPGRVGNGSRGRFCVGAGRELGARRRARLDRVHQDRWPPGVGCVDTVPPASYTQAPQCSGFLDVKTTWTLAELAEYLGASLEGDPAAVVNGLGGLDESVAGQVSFLGNPAYGERVAVTLATAVLVPESFDGPAGETALLRCADPNGAFTRMVELFIVQAARPEPGVHAGAHVADDTTLGEGVAIGAGCTLGSGVVLGDRVVLHPGVHLGLNVRVGADTELQPGVVLYARTVVGERCLIQAGTVVGSDGFGFDQRDGKWVKVPQAGTVRIEDDVEIGANSTIDRGRFGATVIGAGSKIDNQVQVAHNVVLGENVMLVAQVGVAGSTHLEPGVVMGGQSGVGGHLRIASGIRIAGGSGVIGSLDEPGDYFGFPARPRTQAMRALALPKSVQRLSARVKALEAKLAEVESR